MRSIDWPGHRSSQFPSLSSMQPERYKLLVSCHMHGLMGFGRGGKRGNLPLADKNKECKEEINEERDKNRNNRK